MKIKELLKKTVFYRCYINHKKEKREARRRVVNEAFRKEAVDVLKIYANIMNEKGFQWWIDYGTLLGYYREHDFIKHDFDIDTSAWIDDHDRIKETLESVGFERVRYYYTKDGDGIEECYRHRNYQTTIDVFYYSNVGEESICYSFLPLVSMQKKHNLNKVQPSRARRWTFKKITPIPAVFKGVNINVPENTADYLASTYGDTFMTPIPNFPVNGRPNLTELTYEEKPACAFLKVGYL